MHAQGILAAGRRVSRYIWPRHRPRAAHGHRVEHVRQPRRASCRHHAGDRLLVEPGQRRAPPPFPAERVRELVQQHAPWQDMLDLMAAASPLGFFIFYKIDVEPTVRLAGDRASGVAYLMGNNTLVERMFRHEPAILLYAPCTPSSGGSQTARPTSPSTSPAANSEASPTLRSRPWARNSTPSWQPCSSTSASPCPKRSPAEPPATVAADSQCAERCSYVCQGPLSVSVFGL
jgi:hypothetical protein